MKQTFLFSLLLLVIRNCSAEKITLRIDLNEPIAVTDPKFLSLTIDPVTLLAGNAVRYVQRVFIINQFSSIFLPINRYFERSKFKKDYILSKYTSPRIFFFFSTRYRTKGKKKKGAIWRSIQKRRVEWKRRKKTARTIPRVTFENKIQSTTK